MGLFDIVGDVLSLPGKLLGGGGGGKSDLNDATARFNRYMQQFEETEFKPLDLEKLEQENVFEDITVDTTAADYATRQFQQQQANIMQYLRGAAGSSGAAGLAQTLNE